MFIKNYHEIYRIKGYRVFRKDVRDETGYTPSLYLTYKVNNNWNTSRPFEIVCSDTTMININGKNYD